MFKSGSGSKAGGVAMKKKEPKGAGLGGGESRKRKLTALEEIKEVS